MLTHAANPALELWGGIECTVNRVGDRYFNQLERNGHLYRPVDLDRIAGLGIRTLRYPLLWELLQPRAGEPINWRWADERLERLQDLGITPIAGLVHHGSGPAHTHLTHPGFAEGLAGFAEQVARRYPWLQYYTPVNEPLTTARFSGLYGHWFPHGRDDRTFVRALINQCRAVLLSIRAVRRSNPQAKLIQTDDLGRASSTPGMQYQADFDNERRWLGWDLLCGRVDAHHPMRSYLLACGALEAELDAFCEEPSAPDIVGINHYVTSDRFLDERCERYPSNVIGTNGRDRYADVEAVRAVEGFDPGWDSALAEAHERYGLPLALTEVHIGCTREEQLRWFCEAWSAAERTKASGADVRAVTAWALFGSFNWNSLLTCDTDHYEPGAFDVRFPEPRPTALARLLRSAATGGAWSPHPLIGAPGWWRRPRHALLHPAGDQSQEPDPVLRQPLLICGATTGAREICEICNVRGITFRTCPPLPQSRCPATPESMLIALNPWALVDSSHYLQPADSAVDTEDVTVFRRAIKAAAGRAGIPLLTIRVRQPKPHSVEKPVHLLEHPASLVVVAPRDSVEAGAVETRGVLNAALDLLIDGESGLWLLQGALATPMQTVRAVNRAMPGS